MVFIEFLEAIVRVAEKTEIPHCVIVSITLASYQSLTIFCYDF